MTVGQLVVHFVRRNHYSGENELFTATVHPKSGFQLTGPDGRGVDNLYPEEFQFLSKLLRAAREHEHAFVKLASE